LHTSDWSSIHSHLPSFSSHTANWRSELSEKPATYRPHWSGRRPCPGWHSIALRSSPRAESC